MKFEAWTVLVATRPVNHREALLGLRLADRLTAVGRLSSDGLDMDQKTKRFTRAAVDKGSGEDLD